MQEFLSELYANSTTPIWSAILLGLLTAVSPCPFATNITALSFVSKDISNKRKVFINGLIYTLGRAVSYVLLAAVLIFSAEQFHLSSFFQRYGEKALGPLLIVIGLFMLGVLNFHIPLLSSLFQKVSQKSSYSYWHVFLIGILFALAFCPYSGVLYFGLLLPMSIESSLGLLLPFVFSIATGIPVIIFAWLLAYAFSQVGKYYKRIQNIELWFRKFIAFIFLFVGIYYCIINFINI